MPDTGSPDRAVITAAKIAAAATVVAAMIAIVPTLLQSGHQPNPGPTFLPTQQGGETFADRTESVTAAPASESPVSLAEWRRDADAVCDGAFANLNALGGPPQTWDDYVTQGVAAIGITRSMTDQVRQMQPPQGQEADVQEWVTHLDEMMLAHSRAIDAVQRGDQAQVASLSTELSIALERANESARKLGLDCIFVQ